MQNSRELSEKFTSLSLEMPEQLAYWNNVLGLKTEYEKYLEIVTKYPSKEKQGWRICIIGACLVFVGIFLGMVFSLSNPEIATGIGIALIVAGVATVIGGINMATDRPSNYLRSRKGYPINVESYEQGVKKLFANRVPILWQKVKDHNKAVASRLKAVRYYESSSAKCDENFELRIRNELAILEQNRAELTVHLQDYEILSEADEETFVDAGSLSGVEAFRLEDVFQEEMALISARLELQLDSVDVLRDADTIVAEDMELLMA